MLNNRHFKTRQFYFALLACLTSAVSSQGAEVGKSYWFSNLNPFSRGNSQWVPFERQVPQVVRSKFDLSVAMMGGQGRQPEATSVFQEPIHPKTAVQVQLASKKQNEEKKETAVNTSKDSKGWVNNPESASKYLLPFQSSKKETSLSVTNMYETVPETWESFWNSVNYLDHFSVPGEGYYIDEPTLKFFGEKLRIPNLASFVLPRQSLALSNIGTALPSMIEILKKHTLLKKIDLHGFNGYNKQQSLIINTLFIDLPPLPYLTHLELSGNSVDDVGLEMLGTYLLNSPLLAHFSIGGTAGLGPQWYTKTGLLALSEGLSKLQKLESFVCTLANSECDEVPLVLLHHPSLKELTIDGVKTSLSQDAYTQMGEALRMNTSLTSFTTGLLETPEKAHAFFAAMEGMTTLGQRNTTLTILNFRVYSQGNGMGDAGAKALASLLETPISISYLNLQGSNMGIEGATRLKEVLENRSIFTWLEGDFSPDVAQILLNLVEDDKVSLRVLD